MWPMHSTVDRMTGNLGKETKSFDHVHFLLNLLILECCVRKAFSPFLGYMSCLSPSDLLEILSWYNLQLQMQVGRDRMTPRWDYKGALKNDDYLWMQQWKCEVNSAYLFKRVVISTISGLESRQLFYFSCPILVVPSVCFLTDNCVLA